MFSNSYINNINLKQRYLMLNDHDKRITNEKKHTTKVSKEPSTRFLVPEILRVAPH